MSLLDKRNKRRMQKNGNDKILNKQTYNALFGVVVLYGLILNYILCAYAVEFAMSINPVILIISYLVLGFSGIMLSIFSKKAS